MTYKIRTWGGIGDVLLTTPSLRALKKAHPNARVNVYCSVKSHLEVLTNNPYIDRLTFSPQWWPEPAYHFGETISALLRSSRFAPLLNTVWRRVHPRIPSYGNLFPMVLRRHATELIAEMLDVSLSDRKLDVFLTPQEIDRAAHVMKAYREPIALHTVSASTSTKNWPIEHWNELVRRNPDRTFVQLGLSSEPLITGAVDFRGVSLRESIALLAQARSFVAVESSLAHAASAVGVSGVVLFGPTSPAVWAHPSNVTVTLALACSPCIDLLRGSPCPYGTPCLSTLPVETVETALLTLLRAAEAEDGSLRK